MAAGQREMVGLREQQGLSPTVSADRDPGLTALPNQQQQSYYTDDRNSIQPDAQYMEAHGARGWNSYGTSDGGTSPGRKARKLMKRRPVGS